MTVSPVEQEDVTPNESVKVYEYVVVEEGEGEYVEDVALEIIVLQLDPVYQ